MKQKYDVIIIGAGPAGLSCAQTLSKSGKSVLILEKNARIGPKVCAGGLTTKIEKVGLSLEMAQKKFSRLNLHCANKTQTIQSAKPFVATIDRGHLGQILLKKLENCDIQTDSTVTKISKNAIEINKNQSISFDYLVGADGSASLVRSFIGLPTRKFLIALQYIVLKGYKDLEMFYDANLFGSGYAWIFPHGGYTSIGCCQDVRYAQNSQLRMNFHQWLKKKEIDVYDAMFQGKIINFDYRGYQFENMFLTGDAAGFASGFTGEGIYFAIISGTEVAKKIIDPHYTCPKIDEILRIKRHHERVLALCNFLDSISHSLLNFTLSHLFPLFNNERFASRVINTYSN